MSKSKSSVKAFLANPDKYEINTRPGPTYVPKGTNKQSNSNDDNGSNIDRGEDSVWQDYAETAADL